MKRIAKILLMILAGISAGGNWGCQEKPKPIQTLDVKLHPALTLKPVAQGLGVNIHFYEGVPQDWKMLSEAGVGIVRMDASWSGAEKKPGQYNFAHYDTLLARLERHHMRLLFILDYGNPLYDNGLAPHSDSALVASAKFCGALAKRYKSRPILFELWNEPNLATFWRPKPNPHQYLAWARAVSRAIREANPKACILGPAMSRIDLKFLQTLFENGYLNLVDGVSVHPYRSPSLGPETAIPEYEMLRALIEEYKPAGKELPIVSGEWGYSTVSTPPVLQGKYLARQWLTNLSLGIPISIWYDWHDDGQDPKNSEHHFGTVTWDYKPKPSFKAMKTLISQLKGFRAGPRVGFGDLHDFVVPFFNGKTVKLALWTTGESHRLELGRGTRIAKAVNFQGKPRQFWGLPRVTVTNAPLYIRLVNPVPGWLQLIVKAEQIGEAERSDVVEAIVSHRIPQTAYGKAFYKAFHDGSVRERRAALHVLTLIADRLSNRNKAVTLYRFILNQDCDLLDAQNAIFGLAARQVTDDMAEISNAEKIPQLRNAVAVYRLRQAEVFFGKGNYSASVQALQSVIRGSGFVGVVNDLVEQLKQKGALRGDSLALMAEKAGVVTHWRVAGPFPKDVKTLGRKIRLPEKKLDYSQTWIFGKDTVKWQPVTTGTAWGIVRFDRLFGKIPGVAYAATELTLPANKWLRFKIGSNDGVVCWVNGKKIYEHPVSRRLSVDEDQVAVRLKKGKNLILLKVTNEGSHWSACLRVCNANGEPLDISGWLTPSGF